MNRTRSSRTNSRTLPIVGLLIVTGLAIGTIGCKPETPAQRAEPASSPSPQATSSQTTTSGALTPAQDAYAPVGSESISGNIAFTGKPPAKVRIDTSMDPACSLSGGDVYAEQYAVANGKLANVFLYVKSGPPAVMHVGAAPLQPVVLDQKNCRYTPHVVGVAQGGTIEFRNSDPTMHNIHTMPTVAGNDTIDVSQGPRGAPQVKRFLKPELMMSVRCNNHPWMNAFINVSESPFFAVSDSQGHFEIHGLPAGDYVLGAVHEKLGEKTVQVTIQPHVPAQASFTFAAR